ncbi:hypothetical protein QYE76_030055 [Lolium multiflorum]|uniref:Reverse transcriptase n=1 Tax=Lolium multiflorum TaxID=4521 RepID=A0AAD8QPQ6_LOLMU|nr:hypothetical protein QYE76_030055 [Lolium multiflorum]
MSSGQITATTAAASETPPASSAAQLPPPSAARGAPSRCRRRRPSSPQELSTAIRDLATAVQGIRLYLIGTQGMTTPVLSPPLGAYPAAPTALPGQGAPTPPPASPPPPWASWPPAPSPGPAPLRVPIQRVQFPPSPSRLPAWVTATESPPIHPSAPAPAPVYTTAGDPPRPSFPDPPPARFAEPSAGRAEYPAQGATGLAPPRYAKLEFATYDGVEDPLNWLNQCEQFFRGQRTLASDRTWLASYHLRGAAQTWYYSLEQDEGGMPPWDRFRELCLLRFGPPVRGSRLAELGRLAFTTTVQDFADRFQALACHAPGVTGQQRAELFIGGLPDHIRVDVELQAPRDLQTAMHYARAYERRAQAVQQTSLPRGTRAARPPPPAAAAARPVPPGPAGPAPAATRTFRRLTPAEQLERRRLGLCFNCDDPYTPGHVCPRLFYLETVDIEEGDPMAGPVAAASEMAGPADAAATAFVVSLHALAGIRHERTMLLPVTIQGEPLVALLDTGSTHNFLPAATMRRLALQPTSGDSLRVTVANGDRLHCHGVVQHVPLTIGDEHFVITCAGIDLGCFDFILGVDFLRTLGPILWDFDALTMTFWRQGRHIRWEGLGGTSPAPQLQLVSGADDADHPLLTHLLQQHSDIFEEPQGLPPPRACDHRIHLLPGSAPVAVRPYRYPQLQKDELERQCALMLAAGIIRISTSPFSAPVLLVRKSDGTWRFCIDYRALNALTLKDKFPIPVVDELFDELHGARFFTKLDLRSGYHQVRMHPEDIAKTAFRTHHGHFEFVVMPFGLTNAPATFQALMNDVLRPYLRRFVLVFFDDILIYSASWAEHLQHVAIVFNELRAHRLHLKRSKCSFATTSVAYLGHVISADGVAMDADKVAAVAAWPTPRSPRALRGFLGLAGYYRKFIRDFGLIASPLTRLLRHEAFAWDDEATAAFEALKGALTTGPVLQMPDFDKPFIVDCDASGAGFGAVLHQGDGPLAYFSRPFAARHLKLAAYEQELIGLVQAVRHWRPYLWGRSFRVRTDHYSLKFLLDQRLSTVPQHQWISKLFGFDFTVEYRPGRLNTVADALSRRDAEPDATEGDSAGHLLCIRSGPSFALFDRIRQATVAAPAAQLLRQQLAAGELDAPWRVADGLLLHGRRVFVPDHEDLRHQVLLLAHSAGHEGVQKTLHRLRADFYIPGDKALVQDWVRSCETCQRNKTETLRPAGVLQPLDVPSQVWADISMDFIEGLPRVGGKSVILTVVDRFSKYAHFIALGHPYTAASVARAFFDGIVRLHGFPSSIVCDRDPVFTGHVWRDLFRMAGVQLRFSTAFHPQTDGQSEVVNKVIAMYLRCVTGDRPRAWVDWLAWAEYCYNTSYHSALRATPFEVVYGRPPPPILPVDPATARTEAAGELIRARDEMLAEVRQRLVQAQQVAKHYYDGRHREVEYAVGDWVWLRLLHRSHQSLDPRAKRKLGPRYAGPFIILERIGTLAYRLQLPEGARIHDVFHVGLLKPYHGVPPMATPPLPPTAEGRLLPSPAKVLRAQLRRDVWHLLVQWEGLSEEEATWEPREEFQLHYPDYQLEDELFAQAGRDVMTGLVYRRRGPIGPTGQA